MTLSGLAPSLLLLPVPLALGLPLVLAMLLAETNIHIKLQSSLTSQKRVNHSLFLVVDALLNLRNASTIPVFWLLTRF